MTTTEFAFWCADFVGALFYFLEVIMKRKATNEDVKQFIKKIADEINSEFDLAVRVAQSKMLRAENELNQTFTDEQKKLYQEYLLARQELNDLWVSRYKK